MGIVGGIAPGPGGGQGEAAIAVGPSRRGLRREHVLAGIGVGHRQGARGLQRCRGILGHITGGVTRDHGRGGFGFTCGHSSNQTSHHTARNSSADQSIRKCSQFSRDCI